MDQFAKCDLFSSPVSVRSIGNSSSFENWNLCTTKWSLSHMLMQSSDWVNYHISLANLFTESSFLTFSLLFFFSLAVWTSQSALHVEITKDRHVNLLTFKMDFFFFFSNSLVFRCRGYGNLLMVSETILPFSTPCMDRVSPTCPSKTEWCSSITTWRTRPSGFLTWQCLTLAAIPANMQPTPLEMSKGQLPSSCLVSWSITIRSDQKKKYLLLLSHTWHSSC